MILTGELCTLRQAAIGDVATIVEWENNTDHWLVSNTKSSYSKEEVKHFIEHENDIFINQQMRLMIINGSNESVGCIDLYDFDVNNKRVGIGILIDPAFRGKGFGIEALTILCRFCFDHLDVRSIYTDVLVNNFSSIRLFESAGFQLNGTKKGWLWDGAEFIDQHFYQLFRSL